jgi:hypothetical protein
VLGGQRTLPKRHIFVFRFFFIVNYLTRVPVWLIKNRLGSLIHISLEIKITLLERKACFE